MSIASRRYHVSTFGFLIGELVLRASGEWPRQRARGGAHPQRVVRAAPRAWDPTARAGCSRRRRKRLPPASTSCWIRWQNPRNRALIDAVYASLG
jgi:hypothetical protein